MIKNDWRWTSLISYKIYALYAVYMSVWVGNRVHFLDGIR